MIEKAWQLFFGKGWDYRNVPSKKDCFEAGYKAGLAEGLVSRVTLLKEVTREDLEKEYPKMENKE